MAVHSNAYAFLILVLTVISLVIMVPLLLPIDPALQGVLTFWDNAICVVFLVDFGWNLWRSHPRRAYLVEGGGWTCWAPSRAWGSCASAACCGSSA